MSGFFFFALLFCSMLKAHCRGPGSQPPICLFVKRVSLSTSVFLSLTSSTNNNNPKLEKDPVNIACTGQLWGRKITVRSHRPSRLQKGGTYRIIRVFNQYLLGKTIDNIMIMKIWFEYLNQCCVSVYG